MKHLSIVLSHNGGVTGDCENGLDDDAKDQVDKFMIFAPKYGIKGEHIYMRLFVLHLGG